jgi:diguanylate cyclase (GGDEF)-like protein
MTNLLELLNLVSAATSLLVAIIASQQRKVRGALELMTFGLVVFCWTASNVVILLVPYFETKLLWQVFAYWGVISVSMIWFIFAARVTLDPVWLRVKVLLPFWIIPIISGILALTNPSHHLFFGTTSLSTTIPGALTNSRGSWWWIHTLYSYGAFLGGVLLLIYAWRQHQGVYRQQLTIWIIAVMIPFIVNAMQQFRVLVWDFDLTPISMSFAATLIMFGLFRYPLLIIKPIALESVLDSLRDGILILDEQHRLVRVNPSARSQFRSSQDLNQVIGQTASSCMLAWIALEPHLLGTPSEQPKLLNIRLDDTEFEYQITPILSARGKSVGHLLIARDVTEVRKYQRNVQELAFRDPLTQLGNRRFLFSKGAEFLARTLEAGETCALLFIDLDRFKEVNDCLGHEFGDRLLSQVAERLKSHVKIHDLISRNGGDEFTILLHNIDSSATQEVAKRLEQAIQAPYSLGEHTARIGASIGMALFPKDAQNIDALLHVADLNMYTVKARNKESRRVGE